MNEAKQLPILVEGRNVGKVVIENNASRAIKASRLAAYHVSTPTNTQFCSFSDASYGNRGNMHFGGVALVYRWQWLPREWASDRTAADPSEVFVEQAWAYGHAVGIEVMEGVGVAESLSAADEAIKRQLSVLKKNNCALTVKVTTDNMSVLQHVASTKPMSAKLKTTIPPALINHIKQQVLMLQNHGVTVVVELHWCPRNKVPQLTRADQLAGKAMKTGLGYCNIIGNKWSKATESSMMKRLLTSLSGAVRIARVTQDRDSTPTPVDTMAAQSTTEARRKTRKSRRVAARTMASNGAAQSRPQLPLPDLALPPKPATANNESTKVPTTKPMIAAPTTVELPKKLAATGADKRKAEEKEHHDGQGEQNDSEERPTKKAKASPVRKTKTDTTERTASSEPPPRQYIPFMPTAWALDPATITITNGRGQELVAISAIWAAPNIRRETASTMETGEKIVFINDGVSGFSVVMPIPRKSTGSGRAKWASFGCLVM
ncbi:hypothetical protein N8I77_005333 [Diaporthe amygdali]|uniref:Uncharacterized protein n=1 Tax=Phomopsis amygdali TaxID=1214568 RepID=A0AAD9SGY9_PHOAM|nr:hypothetical protein N8I77_005333 [Diaporthe amygdali]